MIEGHLLNSVFICLRRILCYSYTFRNVADGGLPLIFDIYLHILFRPENVIHKRLYSLYFLLWYCFSFQVSTPKLQVSLEYSVVDFAKKFC